MQLFAYKQKGKKYDYETEVELPIGCNQIAIDNHLVRVYIREKNTSKGNQIIIDIPNLDNNTGKGLHVKTNISGRKKKIYVSDYLYWVEGE